MKRVCPVIGLMVATTAFGQFMPRSIEPTSYYSLSKVYRLWINPTTRRGGPAEYQMFKSGKPIWKEVLPYTLEGVSVADSGMSAGSKDPTYDQKSTLRFVILGSDGKVVANHDLGREGSYVDGPEMPLGEGTLIDSDDDFVIERAWHYETRGKWHVYRLHDGMPLESFRPSEKLATRDLPVWEASRVAGTPLILTRYGIWPEKGASDKAPFALVDRHGNVVWRATFRGASGPETEDRNGKNIYNTNTPKEFELHLIQTKQLVRFSVTQSGTSWTVKELSRKSFITAEPPKPVFTGQSVRLAEAGRTSLYVPRKPSTADKVGTLRFVDSSGFAFTSYPDEGVLYFSDFLGKVTKQIKLPGRKGKDQLHVLRVNPNSLLIVNSKRFSSETSNAWSINVSTGKAKQLLKFHLGPVQSAAVMPDGHFVVLAGMPNKYTTETYTLAVFDKDGNMLWKRVQEPGYSNKPEELLSPEGVAFTSDGDVAVTDSVCSTIQYF